MRKKTGAWALFFVSILLVSFATTPYSRAADVALISLRLTLVIVLSILVVRERWRTGEKSPRQEARGDSDVGDRFLERCRRWYHGDEENPR